MPTGTIVVSEYPSDETGKVDKTARPGWYAIKDDPALSGTDITNPKQEFGEFNEPNVSFDFTDQGRDAFQEVTRKIAQRGQAQAVGAGRRRTGAALSGHFAVVLDNEVKTRPIINFSQNPDGIDGRTGAQISGGFTSVAGGAGPGHDPADRRPADQPEAGQPNPGLGDPGHQALNPGIKAGVIGVALVVIFLLLYYRFLGLIASVALGAYGVIFFALIKLIPITLTLPGIAGLVLTIGVAADSNIVIFERIKEEVRAGRSMSSAIVPATNAASARSSTPTSITLLTAFILFVLATSGVKGFAFTLGVGTIVSLLTAVVFTQALLGSMSRSRLLRSPSALGAGGKGIRWHFDFMGASRWFFSISGVILLVGALRWRPSSSTSASTSSRAPGSRSALVKATDEEGVRDSLDAIGVSGEEIQQVSDPVFGDNVFQIQTGSWGRTGQRGRDGARRGFGVVARRLRQPSVGPTFGEQVANSALKALIFSLLVICGYVALRFDPKFAVPVLIAIFHDILITAGVYSLTGKEVTSGTVAAFLTILGYSIYDTIIVFDRIRENVPRMPRAAFSRSSTAR